jgi:hypothetical protein
MLFWILNDGFWITMSNSTFKIYHSK